VVLLSSAAYGIDRDDLGNESGVEEEGAVNDNSVSATAGAKINYTRSGSSGAKSSGSLTSIGNWSPPACWYAPKWTAQEAASTRFDGTVDFSPQHDRDNAESMRDKYIDGKHGPFNTKKNDKGYWWGVYTDPEQADSSAAARCAETPFWVDTGDEPPPEIGNTINPEILAQLAYQQIRIPEATPTLQPDTDRQVVNVPTWVSLDGAAFQPVSVTASVDVLGISATTTATPASLHIDPGTDDALTFPESGECPLNDDGSVGQKWAAGVEGDPPCGVQYLRSTEATGPYEFEGSVTWNVSWTGANNPDPTDLPSGTFASEQDVTVREVQSVVR
jgi:enoyl reductase